MTDLGDQPVSSRDRQILRELAQHVRDISQHPRMAQSRARWFQTNRLQLTRPPVQISLDGASDDFVPPQTLCCEDAAARAAEYRFRCFIAYHERLRCDTLIQARWQVPQVFHDTGWGLAIQHKASTQEKGAWAFDPVINEPADLKKLRFPEVVYDEAASQRRLAVVHELFGDILDVHLMGVWLVSFHLMSLYCQLRGFEQVLLDMYDEPQMLRDAMAFLEEGHHRLVRQYVDLNLLYLDNRTSLYATDLLPTAGFQPERVRTSDVWAWADAQELTNVSPDMTWEFSMQHDARLLQPFGLTTYGCCEDLTDKLDLVDRLPHLRQVGVTPWANVAKCAEKIGTRYVISWRPNPAHLVGGLDENFLRLYFRENLTHLRHSVFHVLLKDVETCEHQPERMVRWSEILDEEISRLWS